MRILLLSAYHSASHRYWCEGLMAAMPKVEWTLKTQPARHFSWRIRASGCIWGLADDPDFDRDYDLIIATSLTDVVNLKAHRPALRDTPLWLYFHENQFAHPLSDRQWESHQQGWQFQSMQNAFLADHISFNTTFNFDSFIAGARSLLKKFPEKLPGRPLDRIIERADVLPVPLTERFRAFYNEPKRAKRIIWNHRWEWDKQPKVFLDALIALHREGFDFELAMLGSGSGRAPYAFREEADILSDHLIHWGEADEDRYAGFIRSADIGVSAALHDFQGLAMLELAQAGATVVVPRRVAYPEVLPGACFYAGAPDDPERDTANLKTALAEALTADRRRQIDPSRLPTWEHFQANYRERIEKLSASPSD
ncbi:MAG: DUF3524 domain-containing protein [Opitutales bacterium]